jgi:ferrous iron transport protein A
VRLIDLPSGVKARVLTVGSVGNIRLRLSELGIRPGAEFRVLQRAGLGGRLIALDCERIALDSRTATTIEVEESSPS